MTRHNLDAHIAWLLSQKVTLPMSVRVPPSANSTIPQDSVLRDIVEEVEEEEVNEEIQRVPSSPIRRPPAVNAAQEFVRPAIPTKIAKPHLPESANIRADESMGKLSSASRSTKPGLMSQPYATPGSTIGSTLGSTARSTARSTAGIATAGSSSLSKGYASFLRGNNDTPSSRPRIEYPLQDLPRSFQTPQTPRQTPRPTVEPKYEAIDAVDLTGDDNGVDLVSRSSSSDIVFGEAKVLWTEASASRAEPLPRSSRKRKSDDISSGRSKRPNPTPNRRMTPKPERNDSLDDFIDIDDVVPESQTRPKPTNSPIKTLKSTAERHDQVEEEYQVTETISRVETRTRKSISRVPSDLGASVSRLTFPSSTPTATAQSTRGDSKIPRERMHTQVPASPSVKSGRILKAESTPSPRKQPRHQTQRIIKDSEDEDEDCFSEVVRRTSCSPHIKNSPQMAERHQSPKTLQHPNLDLTGHKMKEIKECKSRIGSPLRPISRNVAVRQDSVPSPFQRDSPTKFFLTPETNRLKSSQVIPDSSFGLDDTKLISLFLKQPTAINLYQERVESLLTQNAVAFFAYTDKKLTAPPLLKEERERLLDMKRAYKALVAHEGRHKSLREEKRRIHLEISQLPDTDLEAVNMKEDLAADLTQKLKSTEKDIALCLHASGAVKDGFGTGMESGAGTLPLQSRESVVEPPSGSNLFGSAQVILQTQLPSLQSNSDTSSNRFSTEELHIRSLSGVPAMTASINSHRQASPSPVRRPNAREAQREMPRQWGSPERRLQQPNFFGGESPIDYGCDIDDADFDRLLQEEQELKLQSKNGGAGSEGFGENYGDSGDDEDMLEVTQAIEERHSFPRPSGNERGRLPLSETSQNSRASSKKDMYSHVDLEKSNLMSYSWSNDVKKALKDRFKLKGFRYHQLEAINATLAGKDAFVLMPTGGGKSLCYQLPAVVQSGKTKGVTIVISPLLSLMNDQVEHLKKINIQACTLNSETPQDEKTNTYANLKETYPEQYIQLLYITPEMITRSGQLNTHLAALHKKKRLARIVIDEAHCVSQWGHDFRPDYVALGQLRENYPGVPIMALTATATDNVKVDVMHNLGMGNCPVFSQSFNRPNLFYEVRSKKDIGKMKDAVAEFAKLIKEKHRRQTGIIYTLSRKNCEQISEGLRQDHNIQATNYHAGLEVDEKSRIQREWQDGTIQVVVATIAFGMGIDKADVRFVIHHTIPKTLEGYYQETGRAGRDGKKSSCYLYYGYQDTTVLKDFIYKGDGNDQQKERQLSMLKSIIQYCENKTDCRRQQVLQYFGEQFSREECQHTCDNCKSDAVFDLVDFTVYSKEAMKLVKKVQHEDVTLLHCVDILRGGSSAKIKQMNHAKMDEYGKAKSLTRTDVERIFFRLVTENAILQKNKINRSGFASNYVRLGPNCRDFMSGKKGVHLQMQKSMSAAAKRTKSTRIPQSTMLTSPPSPSSRRKAPASRFDEDEASDDEVDYDDDLGPPITTDEQLSLLPDMHRVLVAQFVEEAKSMEEKIRNKTSARKPFFTETDFREMSIKWTLNLRAMRKIPSINRERVDEYGKHFIPLVEKYHENYVDLMEEEGGQDMDTNHRNVIDLVSDGDDDEEDDNYGLEDGDEEAILAAEKSQYFLESTGGRKLPWNPQSSARGGSRKPPAYRGGGAARYRSKSRGGKRTASRRSNSSTSGWSNSGVSKRSSTGESRKPRAGKSSAVVAPGNFMKKYGRQGGAGGGGGGGGIGPMPT